MYKLGAKLPNGYFDSFETLTDEQAHWALIDAWATPEQQTYNLLHTTCPTCKGKGYETRRIRVGERGFRFEHDNCGCPQCLGTGAIPK